MRFKKLAAGILAAAMAVTSVLITSIVSSADEISYTVSIADGFEGNVTVDKQTASENEEVAVEDVTLNFTEYNCPILHKIALTATVYPENASNKNVSWSSSDESVAMVDENGNFYTISAGTAVITVTTEDGDYTATCTVTVTNDGTAPPICGGSSITGVTIDQTKLELAKGESYVLTATLVPEDAMYTKIIWTSSNDDIATVDENGKVTAVSAGTAVITATTSDGGYTAECTVTVKASDDSGNSGYIPTPNPKPTVVPSVSTVTVNKEPQIKGDNGKTGWSVVLGELENAEDGDTVVVDMNGATELPKSITSEIKGKDITLVLEMYNGFVWTINGLDVTNPKTVDMRVSKVSKRIPVDIINNVTGENSNVQLSLEHNGDFGFTAVLTVGLGKKNNGLYANLFYYNKKTGELELTDFDKIEKGKAELVFTHASEWAVVVDKEVLGEIDDISSAAGVADENDVVSFKAGSNPTAYAVISFVGVIISAAAVVIARKRKKQ